jgi:hemerythrin-like domain-containing protein
MGIMLDSRTAPSVPTGKTAVQARLASDHRVIEELLTQLANALDGANPQDLCDQWTRFERNLRDHLDTEERCLFPLVASAHRNEIEALRLEHRHIRRALSELGLSVDLHTLRKASVDELFVYLQQHARREDQSLYAWLDESTSAQHGLRAMFARRTQQATR